VAAPAVATDAANKQYVDNTAAGLSTKASCMCATTANITLSGLQAIDGYTTVAGDRVLVKNQTTASGNGIYVAAAGAWARSTDTNTWAELVGAYTFISQGTVNASSGWTCNVAPGGTLGTTAVTWVQFTGAGEITVTAPLTKTGNNLAVSMDGTTIDAAGAGSSLEVMNGGISAAKMGAGSVNLASTTVTGVLPVANGGTGSSTASGGRAAIGAAGYYTGTYPATAGTSWTIPQATHGLHASRGILVQVADVTSNAVELPDIAIDATGLVTITYAVSVPVNQKQVTLIG
jgi:phage-related tail fiber protein